ncbi:helix-turn-helix transcriptional regulator [Curtobacterium sp. SORGH_AS_0776]|uniref:helix-turn-helix transcriptional regulator n=1 Tax=Curtobacterium sp. SORGH_AS_0776 TaxID=3041798 RepID=UPI00285C1516|nr:helix-turn-helix transcriptional regulator [Curtobacterium sp. SORGH_AS_0776]MDR6172735.1 transcriptional regulator with XRE-family HTH domain [Curtobacterium sp. SORGH_AS_0776]
MDRPGLADFLRRRRELLRPEDVGLGSGQRRRTPGLRREEVAALAGMSADYYTRLEQQRGPQPSEQMVAAIARALRCILDERDHLFRLAGHNAPARVHRSDHVDPAILRVLDRLEDTPAIVVNDLGETLVENRLGAALLGTTTGLPGNERYQPWRWFMTGYERAKYAPEEHERLARAQVAALRAAVGAAGPTDTRAAELIADLEANSADFRALWSLHDVASRWEDHKTFVHPELGRIAVDCQVLHTTSQTQALLLFTAPTGSEDAQKLELLGVVGQQTFAR